jgi:hypothetical protein
MSLRPCFFTLVANAFLSVHSKKWNVHAAEQRAFADELNAEVKVLEASLTSTSDGTLNSSYASRQLIGIWETRRHEHASTGRGKQAWSCACHDDTPAELSDQSKAKVATMMRSDLAQFKKVCAPPYRFIEWDWTGKAGVDDRLTILVAFLRLAFALKAILIVPKPCSLLTPDHNGGTFLPCEMGWDRYYNITFLDPAAARSTLQKERWPMCFGADFNLNIGGDYRTMGADACLQDFEDTVRVEAGGGGTPGRKAIKVKRVPAALRHAPIKRKRAFLRLDAALQQRVLALSPAELESGEWARWKMGSQTSAGAMWSARGQKLNHLSAGEMAWLLVSAT